MLGQNSMRAENSPISCLTAVPSRLSLHPRAPRICQCGIHRIASIYSPAPSASGCVGRRGVAPDTRGFTQGSRKGRCRSRATTRVPSDRSARSGPIGPSGPDAVPTSVPSRKIPGPPCVGCSYYLKGGTGYGVTDYWLVNGQMHFSLVEDDPTKPAEHVVPYDEVDIQKTIYVNTRRGFRIVFRDKFWQQYLKDHPDSTPSDVPPPQTK
jgi:hypothetical protein